MSGSFSRRSENLRCLGVMLCAAALLATGCRRGPRNFENENDELRRQVVEMTEEIDGLRLERDEAVAKLAEVERMRSWDGEELSEAVRLALPRCAGIEFGLLSGAGDADNLPGFDVLDIYIVPRDGRGRFVQIVGTLEVRADLLPGISEEARFLGSARLGPDELREAYRSGLMGTHYTVRMPLDPVIDEKAGSIALSAELTDALTGRVHAARKVVPVPDRWE